MVKVKEIRVMIEPIKNSKKLYEEKIMLLDENINKFLKKENIKKKDLIDIKYSAKDNRLDNSALIIYCKNESNKK